MTKDYHTKKCEQNQLTNRRVCSISDPLTLFNIRARPKKVVTALPKSGLEKTINIVIDCKASEHVVSEQSNLEGTQQVATLPV